MQNNYVKELATKTYQELPLKAVYRGPKQRRVSTMMVCAVTLLFFSSYIV